MPRSPGGGDGCFEKSVRTSTKEWDCVFCLGRFDLFVVDTLVFWAESKPNKFSYLGLVCVSMGCGAHKDNALHRFNPPCQPQTSYWLIKKGVLGKKERKNARL